jgi:hypothetical protein
MEQFKLEKIGSMEKNPVLVYVCIDKSHKISMKKEEAKLRGIESRWEQEGENQDDGFFQEVMYAKVIKHGMRFNFARVGKKPKIIKVEAVTLRCPGCTKSETIIPVSVDDPILEELKAWELERSY